MRPCKYIVDKDRDFCLNQIYYYEIIIHKYEIYPYFIYLSADNSKKIAQFSEGYFKKVFIDIKQERKLKLQKINESDLHK